MIDKGVNFEAEVEVGLCKSVVFLGYCRLVLGELGDGLFQAFEGGLTCSVFRHGGRGRWQVGPDLLGASTLLTILS